MNQIQSVLEALNDSADRDLGAVVLALDARGQSEQGDLLVACELSYEFDSEWGEGMAVIPVLSADPAAHPLVSEATLDFVEEQCSTIHNDWYVSVTHIRFRLRTPAGDWRERRQALRDRGDRGVDNQGTYRSIASIHREDRLNFGSDEEVLMYRALVRKQDALPAEATIGIVPGPAVRVRGRTFWPDFVVTYLGRVGMIEVDGPHHYQRAAADHSRDALFGDSGITYSHRIVVEDTTDPKTLDLHVERFLQRLVR
jgi:hypothetical protein